MFGLGVLELFIVLGLPFGAAGIVVWRFIRAYERRSIAGSEIAQMQERLLRVEEALGSFQDQLDQISEGQRFTTQVLAGRTANTDESAT